MKTSIILLAAVLCATNLFAQGAAFTYQGRLDANGAPANGTYDLLFTVYASATGVNDGFANQTNAATVLSNGLFTATLDFPPGIFTGEERWLEIAVRPSGFSIYTNLSPRQKITATPYAITAGNLSGSIGATQLSGVIPLAQLPAAVVTNNQSGVNISGTFNGNGGSLTNLNSENLTGLLTVSNSLVSVGHIYDGGSAQGVAVSGNFAYLANADDGLRVYDIANPANPVSIGHIDDGGTAFGVAVSGNFAYLANWEDGLRVYNIANPANPVSIGHISDGAFTWGVAVSGNFAYLANWEDGLRVYNIANPTNPVSIGYINDGGATFGVAVWGNYAYLANYNEGLRVYDIADPANPVSIGHIDDGGFALGVAVSGTFAYIANNNDGLRVYGIGGVANALGFRGDGGFLTGLNADNVTSGTLADARLSANVALRSGGNAFTGNQTVMSGNVGIGTPVPASKLEVQGAVAAIRLNPDLVAIGSNADGYELNLVGGVPDGTSMGGQIRLGGSSRGDADINAIQFKQNNSEVMRIDNGGNVGIGTASPGRALQVGDAAIPGSQGMIRLASRTSTGNNVARTWDVGVPQTGDDASGTGYSFVIKDALNGSATNTTPEFMIKYVTGYVGLGTNVPSEKLHVIGNIRASGSVTATALDVRGDVKLGSSGELFGPGGVENMRILRGHIIGTTGSTAEGSGFTAFRNAPGRYTITFGNAFNGRPSITVSPLSASGDLRFAVVESLSASTATIRIWDFFSGTAADNDFFFIAIGSR